jgi:hypothetical protein
MKYIKIYEEQQFEFKIGDYVRRKGKDNILIIIDIESEFKSSPYACRDIKTNDFHTPIKHNLELVPDYEIRAIKYNL